VVPPPKSTAKWQETVAEFEQSLVHNGFSTSTVRLYGQTIRGFSRFYLEELGKPGPYISRLDESDFVAFVRHLESARYLSQGSLNRTVSALRAFSLYLLETDRSRRDVGRALKTSYVPPKTDFARLNKAEQQRLLAAPSRTGRNGIRDRAILRVIVYCGLRVGEISSLCVEDVPASMGATAHLGVRDEGGRKSREVPLNGSGVSALRRYLKIRGQPKGSDPLFVSQQGRRLSEKSVQHLVKKYLCMIGRADLSARDLRDFCALEFYAREKDLAAVQRLLGYKSLAAVLRYMQPTEGESPLEGR
jgi:site-specific recombinase XerD